MVVYAGPSVGSRSPRGRESGPRRRPAISFEPVIDGFARPCNAVRGLQPLGNRRRRAPAPGLEPRQEFGLNGRPTQRAAQARRAFPLEQACQPGGGEFVEPELQRNFQWVLRPETGFAPYFSRVLRAW